MQTIKGPSLFIAQFINADPRLATLEGLTASAPDELHAILDAITGQPSELTRSLTLPIIAHIASPGPPPFAAIGRGRRRRRPPQRSPLPNIVLLDDVINVDRRKIVGEQFGVEVTWPVDA
jgi:hypothetical protein